jgi:hypothetical protein
MFENILYGCEYYLYAIMELCLCNFLICVYAIAKQLNRKNIIYYAKLS